jgi:hypothetical protein
MQQEQGKFCAPIGALYRITGGLEHFYCSKQSELTVPAGKYLVNAFHGLEYRPTQQEFELTPGENKTITLELDR